MKNKILYLIIFTLGILSGCGKNDDASKETTSLKLNVYKLDGRDTVSTSCDIYIFAGEKKINGPISLLEIAPSSKYQKSNSWFLETEVEPGLYTIAVQIPITSAYSAGACSFKTVEIKQGEKLILKKVFEPSGSYTTQPW